MNTKEVNNYNKKGLEERYKESKKEVTEVELVKPHAVDHSYSIL
jgi:hypothetical protein